MQKVIYVVPPMKNAKGYATIGQNRQFQWFTDPFFAYPIVPALSATMLANSGKAQVLWLDAVASELNEVEFGRAIVQMMPQYLIFEAPTPLIKRYWEVINGIKQFLPHIKVILCGQHVTALPEESKKECNADFIVQGGDWHYEVFKIITGAEWDKKTPLPHINRQITNSWLYAYKNGNFRYLPGTYIMSAMDCWYRKCKFCSWATYHKNYHIRDVQDVLTEIEGLICMGFKEIFDDSGTFPTGEWLRTFCQEVIDRGYNDHVAFSCNMRFGALGEKDFALLKQAGFRMLLWGFESANQRTLDKLNKGYDKKAVMQDLILARAAGLESHLTVMFGYHWESCEDAKRTYNMVRWLLKKGWASSAQATICIPYPGTPLWQECKEQGKLATEDWTDYDMSKPVMKLPYYEKRLFALQKGIYNAAFHPEFIARKIAGIKSFEDLKYYIRIGQKVYDRFGNFHDLGKVVKG